MRTKIRISAKEKEESIRKHAHEKLKREFNHISPKVSEVLKEQCMGIYRSKLVEAWQIRKTMRKFVIYRFVVESVGDACVGGGIALGLTTGPWFSALAVGGALCRWVIKKVELTEKIDRLSSALSSIDSLMLKIKDGMRRGQIDMGEVNTLAASTDEAFYSIKVYICKRTERESIRKWVDPFIENRGTVSASFVEREVEKTMKRLGSLTPAVGSILSLEDPPQ